MPPIRNGKTSRKTDSENPTQTAPKRLTHSRKYKILQFQQTIRRNPIDENGNLIEIGSQVWKEKLVEFFGDVEIQMSDLDRWMSIEKHKWIREMKNAVVLLADSPPGEIQEESSPLPQDCALKINNRTTEASLYVPPSPSSTEEKLLQFDTLIAETPVETTLAPSGVEVQLQNDTAISEADSILYTGVGEMYTAPYLYFDYGLDLSDRFIDLYDD